MNGVRRSAERFAVAQAATAVLWLVGCGGYSPPAIDGGRNVGTVQIPSTCTGQGLRGDTALDLNVRTVRVQGTLRFNGQPLAGGNSNGQLHFIDRRTNAPAVYDFRQDASTFAISIAPGHYDVFYTPAATCGLGAGPICQRAIVATNADFTADTMRDFDVTTAHVHGMVHAAAAPGDAASAGIVFAPTVSGDTTQALSTAASASAVIASDGSYDIVVAQGAYTLGWLPPMTVECVFGGSTVPCNSGPISQQVTAMGDMAVDVNVPSAEFTATVTVDGQPPPTSTTTPPGSLQLFLGDETPALVALQSSVVHQRILIGTYAIAISPPPVGGCNSMGPWPCMTAFVATSLNVSGDTMQTFNLQTVRVSGQLTGNGAPLPDTTSMSRGTLQFVTSVNASTSRSVEAGITISGTGPASFAIRLPQGTYDAWWQPSTGCSAATNVPCTSGRIASGLAFQSDTTHNLDLPSTLAQVTLTLNGGPMPDGFARGAVTLASSDGTSAGVMSLSMSGDATGSTRVLPGHYDVGWAGAGSTTCSTVACGAGVLQRNVDLGQDRMLALDLQTAHVHGTLTENGSVPATTMGLALQFYAFDPNSSWPVANMGGPYMTTVPAGQYTMVVVNQQTCNSGSDPSLLCGAELVGACQ